MGRNYLVLTLFLQFHVLTGTNCFVSSLKKTLFSIWIFHRSFFEEGNKPTKVFKPPSKESSVQTVSKRVRKYPIPIETDNGEYLNQWVLNRRAFSSVPPNLKKSFKLSIRSTILVSLCVPPKLFYQRSVPKVQKVEKHKPT